jgi:hypothetical protein
MAVADKVKRRSPRGNWLVVVYLGGKIYECKWVRTQAGVAQSKRAAETAKNYFELPIRVMVLEIERMVQFAVTESYNEILDLEALYRIGDPPPTDG